MIEHLKKQLVIENALTGAEYRLQPISDIQSTPEVCCQIAAICNEALVYRWCFQSLCKGDPYPPEMAVDWIASASEGWRLGTHFVYIITDAYGEVAAACDIKSAHLDRAEMGYWSSASHRGIMTNAARAVTHLADTAGFQVLYADIHPGNHRSLACIQRCGFSKVEREATIVGHLTFDRHRPQRED